MLDWVAEHPVDRIDKFLSWNVAGDMGWPRLDAAVSKAVQDEIFTDEINRQLNPQGRYNQTKTPANEAFIRLASVAATSARVLNRATSSRRFGAMALKPPSNMATEPKLANSPALETAACKRGQLT